MVKLPIFMLKNTLSAIRTHKNELQRGKRLLKSSDCVKICFGMPQGETICATDKPSLPTAEVKS